MPEYIDREALCEKIRKEYCNDCNNYKELKCKWCQVDEMLGEIEDAPTADVAEVRHGEWVLLDECSNEGVYCSVCHKKVYRTEYANQKLKSNFCPNCGADMRKGEADG